MNKLQLARDEGAKNTFLEQQKRHTPTVGQSPGAGAGGTNTGFPYFAVDPDGRVYNALSYTRTNSLPSDLPMYPIRLHCVKATPSGEMDIPDAVAFAKASPDGVPLIMDAESWLPIVSVHGWEGATARAWALMELCQRIHAARPLTRFWGFGLYGMGGVGGMHPDNPKEATAKWMDDQLFYGSPLGRFTRGLAGQVSWLTPSAYPCFTDMEVWKRWVGTKIKACRSLVALTGRQLPVVPFITYRWHPNCGPDFKDRLVPGEVFRSMLMYVLNTSDGAIPWDWDGYGVDGNYADGKIGHGTQPLKWSDTAEWYLATKSILRTLMIQKAGQMPLISLEGGE